MKFAVDFPHLQLLLGRFLSMIQVVILRLVPGNAFFHFFFEICFTFTDLRYHVVMRRLLCKLPVHLLLHCRCILATFDRTWC